ncbi:hypothetical protein C8Q76DRAFT_598175, partial [Earliella scabrosa]
WFEDGNVDVVAHDTVYRVHQSVLGRQSQVFSGAFSMPHTEFKSSIPSVNDTGHSNGVPLIHLPDSAYDVKQLLLYLYDGYNRFKATDAVPFAVVAALARLGHKYQLDGLLAESIRRLKSAFPSDLAEWDVVQGGSTALMRVNPTDAIEAFNLFRRIGEHAMLPSAMYGCAQLDCGELLRGVTRADG